MKIPTNVEIENKIKQYELNIEKAAKKYGSNINNSAYVRRSYAMIADLKEMLLYGKEK